MSCPILARHASAINACVLLMFAAMAKRHGSGVVARNGVTTAEFLRLMAKERGADEAHEPNSDRWLLYVLRSARGHPYVGVTPNLRKRVRRHNGLEHGGAQRTRRHRPWTPVLFVHGFKCKRDALVAEHAVHKPLVRTPAPNQHLYSSSHAAVMRLRGYRGCVD